MTSLEKAQETKRQSNVLYIIHRMAILLAVAAVFYPGFNPGRITTAINRNVSLFTASISYSSIVSNLERALLRGWVQNTTFILVMVASIILIVGILVCCIGGCMSVGNRKMRRCGLYFPLAGGAVMAAGLGCLYVAYSHIVAAANTRVPANFPGGFTLYLVLTALILLTSVVLLIQERKNPEPLEEKMQMQEKYQLFLLFLPVLALAFVFSYLPLWGWRYAFFDYTAGSELSADGRELYLFVVPYRRDERSMDGPVQEIIVSSPQPDMIRLQTVHFKGDRKKYPKFDIVDTHMPLDYQEDGNEITVRSGNTRLVIQKKDPCSFTYYYGDRKLTNIGNRYHLRCARQNHSDRLRRQKRRYHYGDDDRRCFFCEGRADRHTVCASCKIIF